MSTNPLVNSTLALGYIVTIGALMNFLTQTQSHKPDTFLAPIAVLSLFTLSAALMAYLFLYQPVMLYIDGKKKQAASLFTKTILSFAVMTALIVVLLVSNAFGNR